MAIHLKGKTTDLDGIQVTRILPNAKKRMVGPFIFFDHMGPVTFSAGEGIDVKPHPHIGLATLTYLTEGSILHRDSLGNELEILPGEVNWTVAGSGIVHSERETPTVRNQPHRLNGVQCWLALPEDQAEMDPEFFHFNSEELPQIEFPGVTGRLIAGSAYGEQSPVKTHSSLFYLDLNLTESSCIQPPAEAEECAIYILSGSIKITSDQQITKEAQVGDFLLLEKEEMIIPAPEARILLLGGDHWPVIPRINWNFVSFDWQRIQQARKDWQEQRFSKIPGDDEEYTPLP